MRFLKFLFLCFCLYGLYLLLTEPMMKQIKDDVLASWGFQKTAPARSGTTSPARGRVDPKGVEGALRTRNSAGRSGSYHLPPGASEGLLPLMLGFHGTGASGAAMVALFRALADERKFIIVAPDSRVSPQGQATWEVGSRPDDVTEDLQHALDCLDEVKALPGVRVDPAHVLAVGFSGGASSAPYIASREAVFTAYAVLHGGAFRGGLGSNRVRGWFSTGTQDPVRPPATVRRDAAAVATQGLPTPVVHVYPGGHGVSDAEQRELVDWWLGPAIP